jgi:hypothetical protein
VHLDIGLDKQSTALQDLSSFLISVLTEGLINVVVIFGLVSWIAPDDDIDITFYTDKISIIFHKVSQTIIS